MHALKEKSYLDQRGAQSAVLVLRSGKPALQRRPSVSAYLRTYEDTALKEAVVLERRGKREEGEVRREKRESLKLRHSATQLLV